MSSKDRLSPITRRDFLKYSIVAAGLGITGGELPFLGFSRDRTPLVEASPREQTEITIHLREKSLVPDAVSGNIEGVESQYLRKKRAREDIGRHLEIEATSDGWTQLLAKDRLFAEITGERRPRNELTITPDGHLIFACHRGVFIRAIDDNGDWSRLDLGWVMPERVTVPNEDEIIVAGGLPTKPNGDVWGGYVMISQNRGNTWTQWPEGPPVLARVNDIDGSSSFLVAGGMSWADAAPLWYRSEDRWHEAGDRERASGLPDVVLDVAIDPEDPNTIYALATGQTFPNIYRVYGGFYKSRDGGETWELKIRTSENALMGLDMLVTHPSEGGLIHWGVNLADFPPHPLVLTSENGGSNFTDYLDEGTMATRGLPLGGRIETLAASEEHIYAVVSQTDAGIYRRDHLGIQAFTQIAGLTPGNAKINGIYVFDNSLIGKDVAGGLWKLENGEWRYRGNLPL